MAGESGIVFVGRKPPMNYVQAIITSFAMSDTKKIVLKARGQAINTAVDVAEITKNRFIKDLKVSNITIGTEELTQRDDDTRKKMVSTMEITLTKD